MQTGCERKDKAMAQTVLYVDRDQPVSADLARAFEACEIELHSFTEVAPAMQFMQEHRVQLVLIDIQMPRLVGFLREARENWRNTDLLLMSQEDQVRHAVQTLAHGVADYVIKPLAIEEVMTKVHRALELQRLRSAHRSGDQSTAAESGQQVHRGLFHAVQQFEYDYVFNYYM